MPATFFFVGENVFKYPNIAREVSDAGFEIGSHTFTHSPLVHNSNEKLENELRTSGKIIEIATKKTPLFYRPPYLLDIGTDPIINPDTPVEKPLHFALQNGYIPVGADVDAKDWTVKSSEELLQNMLKEVPNGHIALLHDGGGSADTKYMAEALEKIIVILKDSGYEFVSLRDLFVPPSFINIENQLSLGSVDANTNNEVSLLQWFLYSEGFLDYESVGGKFDTVTMEALKNWQIENKVVSIGDINKSEYGTVGKKTSEAIFATSSNSKVFSISAIQTMDTFNANDALQRFNLSLISWVVSVFKYVFKFAIVFIIFRIIIVVGLFIFSITKNIKERKNKKIPQYKGGVSILIPAYNEEENIESSIRSVLKNDYPLKEIIVINDGSIDGTLKVAEKMQVLYPKEIKIINIMNSGKFNALNVGIKACRYNVFIAMDADTIFAPDTISNLMKHFNDKSVGAVAGKVETTKSHNILNIFQSIEYEIGQNIEKKAFASVNAISVVPGPVGAWRKPVVIKCGGYSNETLVEDQDLTLAVITNGYKIVYEPKAIAYTETPHTLKDFLKQRFRWIYGTFQCAWKYKSYIVKKPISSFSLVIMPNTLLFNIIMPLFYPIIDAVFLFAIITGSWKQVIITYIIFTGVDVIYSSLAFVRQNKDWSQLLFVPIQRLYYRQVICYVVIKSIIKAIEGSEEIWGKVIKRGDSQKYYFSSFEKLA